MVVDNGEFLRDGPTSKNHHSVYEPVTVCWMKKTYFWWENTTKKGCATMHATSPFLVYKISNSKLILYQKPQPPKGSQSVETWRTWIQHILHTKYNWLVSFLRLNTLFLRTWWVPEKGKEGKSFVPRNDNLKGGKMKDSLRAFVSQIL